MRTNSHYWFVFRNVISFTKPPTVAIYFLKKVTFRRKCWNRGLSSNKNQLSASTPPCHQMSFLPILVTRTSAAGPRVTHHQSGLIRSHNPSYLIQYNLGQLQLVILVLASQHFSLLFTPPPPPACRSPFHSLPLPQLRRFRNYGLLRCCLA